MNPSTSRMGVLLVLLAAFAGAGCEGSGRKTPPPAETKIGTGLPFPNVPVLTLEGDTTDTATLTGGKESLVIFVAIGCETCEEFVAAWVRDREQIPADLRVFGITEEEPEFARRYADEKKLPFPLYCDERGAFANKYGIAAYPTVAGLYTDGKVAYIGRGVNAEFTPEKARALLVEVKKQREERSRGAVPQ